VSRRVSLPAADDLFRSNRQPRETREHQPAVRREMAAVPYPAGKVESAEQAETAAAQEARRSSGRVRHDEKMTVYVTADELLDIEHARLSLRRDQGLAVDRGRFVREAIAIGLATRKVARGTTRAEAEKLAAEIAGFPPIAMTSDRQSAYESFDRDQASAIRREMELSLAARRQESQTGAARFAKGEGRHGSFERK